MVAPARWLVLTSEREGEREREREKERRREGEKERDIKRERERERVSERVRARVSAHVHAEVGWHQEHRGRCCVGAYRGTSPTRNRLPPYDPPRTLGIGLR